MNSSIVVNSTKEVGAPRVSEIHKTVAARTKHAAHRHERRKVRELLRHGVDAEEESLQFEQFSE